MTGLKAFTRILKPIDGLKSPREGLIEGRKEEKIDMAQKMKEKGTEVEFISEINCLSREEIEVLDLPSKSSKV